MTAASIDNSVQDNKAKSRFELEEQGLTAFAEYRLAGDTIIIPHVEAPIPLRGTGTAERLMRGLLAIVRAEGLKVVPSCPYADVFIRRHKEYQDLLA
jgi:predicted GNAT family acetyltransferase